MSSDWTSWRRDGGGMSERGILMWLRWLIALTLLLLSVFASLEDRVPYYAGLVVVAALVAINILFSRLGQERLRQWSAHPAFFVVDFGLMTVAMLLVAGVVEGVHLLYFLAVLIGASIPRRRSVRPARAGSAAPGRSGR